jgi:hypothetical protein
MLAKFPYALPFHSPPIENPCAVLVRAANPVAEVVETPFIHGLIEPDADVNDQSTGVLIVVDEFETVVPLDTYDP